MDISNLESEYVEFIQSQDWGTPIIFAKPGQTDLEQDIESYYYKHSEFLAWCVPCGCACPCNIICWTALFPVAIFSAVSKRSGSKENAVAQAQAVRRIRYVLFPTLIVKLSKDTSGKVFLKKGFNFLDHPSMKHEVDLNIDAANNDGINGCIQNSMVPDISCLNIYASKTRQVFTGGDRRNPLHYETRGVPELQIITPIEEAMHFSKTLQEILRNVRTGDFERPPGYVQYQPTSISSSNQSQHPHQPRDPKAGSEFPNTDINSQPHTSHPAIVS
jgi:hypothetical protein